MALVPKYFNFEKENGDILTVQCMCRKTDGIVTVIMPKINSHSPFLGRYLTARGFSSVRAAQIATNDYLFRRYCKLNGKFDIGIGIYQLREKLDPCLHNRSSLLFGRVPRVNSSHHFTLFDHLPCALKDFKDFHRSMEELKSNTVFM